jgi:hypothetical protein
VGSAARPHVTSRSGHPFKCPPAPFEGALLLHDHFVERGIRDSVEIRTVGPIAAGANHEAAPVGLWERTEIRTHSQPSCGLHTLNEWKLVPGGRNVDLAVPAIRAESLLAPTAQRREDDGMVEEGKPAPDFADE